MPKRVIAVIDGNSLVHRAFHALPDTMTAPDGRPTNAVFGFLSMLLRMVADLRPDGVVVAFDKGMPAFRKEALELYKAHRPPTHPDLKVQFPMVKETLAALGVPIVEEDGWEGDDILGTLAERGKRAGIRVLLVTGDRDALQLVDEDVLVVTTRKGVTDIMVYDPAKVEERFGVTPAQIPDYLGLKGDTSDNIPGVPGIGEKTAAKLIAEHGSLDAVLAAADTVKGKLGENLREHADAARASRQVATIRCDVPMEIDLEGVRWGEFDELEMVRVFGAFQFRALLDRALASRGGAAGEAEAPVLAEAGMEPWPLAEDPDGSRMLAAAETAGWVGVALDDGDDGSLFPERVLAVAVDGAAFVVRGDAVVPALERLLRAARIASSDVKRLLAAVCPADVPGACDVRLAWVDPARLFDCEVAAYLLESGRQAYGVQTLLGEVTGARLPPAEDAAARAGGDAQAALALVAPLGERLVADGSRETFDRIEMPLVPVLARMESVGVGIDAAGLDELSAEMRGRIDGLLAEIRDLAGTDFNVDSPKQLAEVLFDKLGLPSGKKTKTGYSTDASVLTSLAPSYPVVAKVLEYRELAKLKSTYVDALPRLVGPDGRLHTTFNQTVAATGRLSSSNPNLQNIPVRTELGRRIRAAFVPARAGDLIVSADYSQIELRILAHLSRDEGLVEAFTSGRDFHAATASRVFAVPAEDVTPDMRRKAKAVNFGIVYGISAHGLSVSLGVGRAEAQEAIDRYFAAYPRVRSYLDETVAEAHRDGCVSTMFGRRRRIPELRSSNFQTRSFGERTAMNHPMQGTAADIMKLAMIETDRRLLAEGLSGRMVLQVHDELVFEAPAGEMERLEALVRETMGAVVELAVPLVVDVAAGADWASAK